MTYLLVLLGILSFGLGWYKGKSDAMKLYIEPTPLYHINDIVRLKCIKDQSKKYRITSCYWEGKYSWFVYRVINVKDKNDVYPLMREDELELFGEDKDETETNSTELS